MRLNLLTIITILFCSSAVAQGTVTGSWYGKAEAMLNGSHDSYLTELIIKQKGNEVEGIFGYYFRDGYKSVFVRGSYDRKTRKMVIKNIPVTYFKSASIDGVDCPMDLHSTLITSKISSTLQGSLITHEKYQYTCPELSFSYTLDNTESNQDSLIRNSVARKLWQPQPEDKVIVSTEIPQMDTAVVFEKRSNIVAQQIEVSSDSLRISFYDNGDVDGDTISVFLNNVPIVTKQALTAEAVNIYIKLDKSVAVNEITMYAENLGKYPPNTALMVVNDGKTRHEVYLSSSLSNNSTVRILNKKTQ